MFLNDCGLLTNTHAPHFLGYLKAQSRLLLKWKCFCDLSNTQKFVFSASGFCELGRSPQLPWRPSTCPSPSYPGSVLALSQVPLAAPHHLAPLPSDRVPLCPGPPRCSIHQFDPTERSKGGTEMVS